MKLYYIQNVGFVGNCLRWWQPDGAGYTCNLDEAWQVSKEQAANLCRYRPKEDVPWPVSVVDAHAERHVLLVC